MKIEIKSAIGSVLFSGDFSSLAEAVVAASKDGAYLSGAYLSRANLSGADLSGAYLSGAYLSRAYLSRANLSGAYLSRANLSGADLSRADLSGADLSGADLSRADLSGADLSGADLSRANLSVEQAKKLYTTSTILPEGDLIGYKKLRGGTIAKLSIPAAARRVGGLVGRKCRAEYAIVLEGTGYSWYSSNTEYAPGVTVRPTHPFDDCLTEECRSGIHFFITREEAEAYEL
jgi:hypothetical protein